MPPTQQKLNTDQFAESIKAKYPQYKDVDNATLTQKMLEKYPQYGDRVEATTPQAAPERNVVQKIGDFLAPTATKSVEKLASGKGLGLRDIAGSALEVGSFLVPAGAGLKALGLGAKGLKALSLGQKVGAGVVTGGLSGGLGSAGRATGEGKGAGDIAKETALGTAFGGAIGGAVPLAPLAPKAVSGATKALLPKQPTALEAAGKVLQGTKAEQKVGLKVFKDIETKGIKTYADLSKKLNEEIKTGLKNVENELGTIKEGTKLSKLKQKVTVGEGAGTISGNVNHVDDALTQLKQYYVSVNDKKSALEIQALIKKANKEGLTPLEINKIAQRHGKDLNAYNASGELASGLRKQAAENTRQGLKETARSFMTSKKAQEADKKVSEMIRVQGLVDEAAEKVSALKQRVEERGLGAKIGRAAFKIFDVATGGIAKGAIGAAFPSNVGLKTLNYLDLEKQLAKNLKIIESLNNAPDSVLVNFFKNAKLPSLPKAPGGAPKRKK